VVVENSDKLLTYPDYNLYSGIFHETWAHEMREILARFNNDFTFLDFNAVI
jgi:phenolic acid decarboxylase